MTRLKLNLVANYVGHGWAALMGLLFIPTYIRFLGMEAYGLIGAFTVIQAWFVLLDLGMTPTLNREMARFGAGVHTAQSISDLLRSIEVICYALAALSAVVVYAASSYLASAWLKPEQLSPAVVGHAISVMGVVVALRFCEGIYRGSLFGLQQQVRYNAINSFFATLRSAGAVAVLALGTPTIGVFFIWQAVVSLLSVSILALSVHRLLPRPPSPPRFSRHALAHISKFAGGMIGISVLGVLLTQVDKLLLSRMLSLAAFGYYMFAANVAAILHTITAPITQALFSRMVELAAQDDQGALAALYHRGAQLVTVLVGAVAVALYAFGDRILFLWTGDLSVSAPAVELMQVLVLGTFLNALMWMPYNLQLAHGWTQLTVIINSVAVAVFIPALIVFVPAYGAISAAWIWVGLNAGYFVFTIHCVHRRLLIREKWRWYVQDVACPIAAAAGVAALCRWTLFERLKLHDLVALLIGGVAIIAAAALTAPFPRGEIVRLCRAGRSSQPFEQT